MAADRSEDDEGHSHGRFDDALDFFSINEGGGGTQKTGTDGDDSSDDGDWWQR
jgi:hypothetical protein